MSGAVSFHHLRTSSERAQPVELFVGVLLEE